MMKAYIFQGMFRHDDFEIINYHIDNIKKEKPNRIIIFSLGEINVLYNYHYLIAGIKDWLVENKTPVYILWAGPDKVLLPFIYGVNTLGSAVGNISCTNGVMLETRHKSLLETAEKLYTCYNNNPKYERTFLVDHLAKNKLLNDGIVTYRYPEIDTGYKWRHHDGSRLMDEDDYTINFKPEYTAGRLPKSYLNGFIDIVCETDTQEGYFIPTEKNAKPWGALKPYLVVSSMNYHKWLFEEYGIEPYTELFDYSFDNEKKIEDRIFGVIENLKNIKKLFSKHPNEKERVYNILLPKLKQNRAKVLKTLQTLKLKNKVIPDCLKFITETDYELVGMPKDSGGGLHFFLDPAWHKKYG
jgi:hypothetical protein